MNTGHLISDMRFLEEIEASSGGAKRHLVHVVGQHAHIADRSSLKRPRPAAAAASSSSSSSTTIATVSSTTDTDPTSTQFHSSRNSATGGGPKPPPALAQKRSRREKLLSKASREREMDLILLSTGMQRRVDNKSHYNKKQDCVHWQIEWVYGDVAKTTQNNSETDTVQSLIERWMNDEQREKKENSKVAYLLKKGRCPANDQRFYDLGDGSQTLRDALKGTSIVEHPVISIVSAEEKETFCIAAPITMSVVVVPQNVKKVAQ